MISSIEKFLLENDFNYARPKIEQLDYVLFPVFVAVMIAVIVAIHFFYRNRAKENRFFIIAFVAKLFGSFFITMIYNYYYKGGDTTAYFNDGRLLLNLLIDNPKLGLEAFNVSNIHQASAPLQQYLDYFRMPASSDTWLITKFSAISQIFSLQTFLNSALLFGFISFFPSWLLFKKFVSIAPKLRIQFAVCFLFLPSVLVWGSGIMKDTITFACLALLFVLLHDIFICGKKQVWRFLFVAISVYLILQIKAYILISFIFPFFLYVVLERLNNSKHLFVKKYLKSLSLFIVVGFVGLSIAVFYGQIEQLLVTMMLEELVQTQRYLSEGVSSGSAYNVGDIEPTFMGFLKAAPASVQFTLFRPFLWESGNPIVLLAALESTFFLLITCLAFAKNYVINVFIRLINEPIILFCIVFAILFAIPVGIASGNYGTLVRYKIPCLPFYLAAMFILLSSNKKQIHSTE